MDESLDEHRAPALRPCRPGEPSDGALLSFESLDELTGAFAEFTRSVQQQTDPDSTLVEIVRAVVELIPGCDEGSISVVLGRRTVSSKAPSSELPVAVDALQQLTGQGPCLKPAYVHETVRVPDTGH